MPSRQMHPLLRDALPARWTVCPQFRAAELRRALPWLTEQGLGVQLRSELGGREDGPIGEWRVEVDELKEIMGDFTGPRHLHAPTFDRVAAWPLMAELFERAWQAARRLGCRSILFHTYLVPLRERGAELALWQGYWRAMATRAQHEGLQIALENVYDQRPDELRTVVDEVALPSLGTCVDLAHASLFAHDHDPVAWLRAMGPRVVQVHMSDNDRSRDQHKPLGQGELDVAGFLRQLAEVPTPVTLVLEVGTLEGAQESVAHLAEVGAELGLRLERPALG